jgi:hypothetical protein
MIWGVSQIWTFSTPDLDLQHCPFLSVCRVYFLKIYFVLFQGGNEAVRQAIQNKASYRKVPTSKVFSVLYLTLHSNYLDLTYGMTCLWNVFLKNRMHDNVRQSDPDP